MTTSSTKSEKIIKVMISGTTFDLPDHREQVKKACLLQRTLPLMMEHLPANDEDAIKASLDMVDEADLYLGIFAHRYGYIPEGHEVSITEMEYNRAVERGIPRLIFIMHEDHPLKLSDIEQGIGAIKIKELKERLSESHIVKVFKSPEELATHVVNSLAQYRQSHLSLFLSSKMQELVNERRAVQSALAEYRMYGRLWEDSAGPQPESIRSTYLAEVEACDIYIGLFWLSYSQSTIDEFEHARQQNKSCIIYEKHMDIDRRDPQLQDFLEQIGKIDNPDGLTIRRFQTPEELAEQVQSDVMRLLTTMFRKSRLQPTGLSTMHDEGNQVKIRASGKGIAISSFSGTIKQIDTEQYIPTKQWLKPARLALPGIFIDRETLLRELIEGLTAGMSVNLVGMGGIGKTYLARMVTAELYDHFPGGIIFVEVGPHVTDEVSTQRLLRELASYAFGGIPPAFDRLQPYQVAAWLEEMAPGRLLVIIDDVWNPTPLLILNRALPVDTVRLITTRDASLSQIVGGKTVYVDSLSLEAGLVLLQKLLGYQSDMRSRTDLTTLVSLLEGHPLALNIVAALIRTPQQIQDVLSDLQRGIERGALGSLRFREGETRDTSLERSLALSYERMTEGQKLLFRLLGVFVEGELITVQAAAAVWNIENETAQAGLFDLVNLGLLTELGEQGSLRYRLHPLLHSYARALLEREGELERACWAHAQYYTDMSRRAFAAIPRNYSLLDQHFQNILLALQWTSEKEPVLFASLLDTVGK